MFGVNAIQKDSRSLTFAKDICDVFPEPLETCDEVLAPKRGCVTVGHSDTDAACLGLTRYSSRVV